MAEKALLVIDLNGKGYVVRQDNEDVYEDTNFKVVFAYCVGYVEAIHGGVKGLKYVSISNEAKSKAALDNANKWALHMIDITK